MFYPIVTLLKNFCVNWWKNFQSVAKTTFYVSRQSVEEIGYFWTLFGFFSQLSGFKPKEIGPLAINFWQDRRNYILRVQKFTLREDYFWKD